MRLEPLSPGMNLQTGSRVTAGTVVCTSHGPGRGDGSELRIVNLERGNGTRTRPAVRLLCPVHGPVSGSCTVQFILLRADKQPTSTRPRVFTYRVGRLFVSPLPYLILCALNHNHLHRLVLPCAISAHRLTR